MVVKVILLNKEKISFKYKQTYNEFYTEFTRALIIIHKRVFLIIN